MKSTTIFLHTIVITLLIAACEPEPPPRLETVRWNHGSQDCASNTDPPIQVYGYDDQTWILRQNKCVHYEAPFMFLFAGTKSALLVDTGATPDSTSFPLFKTVRKILNQYDEDHGTTLELVVSHSHNHSDHRAADKQFENRAGVRVVGLLPEAVAQFFNLKNWPHESSTLDLGDRLLDVLPIPGHEPSSIAFFDAASGLLLTGDTFYPGRLYVRDWNAFKTSIHKLSRFCINNKIKYIVGNHIEMSIVPGIDYPVETIWQPHEVALPLSRHDLRKLDEWLMTTDDTPVRKGFDYFIVTPLN